MASKLSILKGYMASDEWGKALSLAAKFPDLGNHKAEITRGHAALQNPEFYRQIGKEPESLIKMGIEALKARYPLSHDVPK